MTNCEKLIFIQGFVVGGIIVAIMWIGYICIGAV